MSKTKIRLLIAFFVLLFAITTPTIILYFQGYRFDLKKRIFVHSGSITIKSWPRDIDIYINDKKQNKKKLNALNGSYTINGIRPGRYKISCKKSGYTSWEKFINVHSGISTEFWNVILFPLENRKELVFSDLPVEQFFLSPREKNEMVLFSKNNNERKIYLLDTEKNESFEIFSTKEFDFIDQLKKENIEWNKNNKKLLLPFYDGQKRKHYFIITLENKKLKEEPLDVNDFLEKHLKQLVFEKNQPKESLPPLNSDNQTEKTQDYENKLLQEKNKNSDNNKNKETASLGIKKIRWMFDKNNELIVLTENNELFYVNIENPQKSTLIEKEVSGFDFAEDELFFSVLPENIIWKVSGENFSQKEQITKKPIPTPASSFLEIIAYDKLRISIRDEQNNLYLYNKYPEKLEEDLVLVERNVQGTQFSNDGKKLLYWTTNEIRTLMLREWKTQPIREKGENIFITRFSQPIKNVQWMDNYENIIFSVGEIIKSAEIDTRNRVNIFDIAQANFSLEEGDVLYSKENQRLSWKFFDADKKPALKIVALVEKGGIFGLNL